jgi:FkbM family methyltransferase
MSIRKQIRYALSGIDRRLALRQWLWRDDQEGMKNWFSLPSSDPFASSPELQHPPPNTVIDIGGSHGQFAKEILRVFPGAMIYSFEPIPECFAEISQLAAGHNNLHSIQLALSDHEGERDLYVSHFRDSSSLQEMLPTHTEAWPHTEIEKRITVQVAQLDEVASRLDLKPPIFAKLDVQGHELAVLRGGRKTLSCCQRVMIECNFAALYDGQPNFGGLYTAMKDLGFLFEGFLQPLRHPRTLEMLSADLIFYKPDSGS